MVSATSVAEADPRKESGAARMRTLPWCHRSGHASEVGPKTGPHLAAQPISRGAGEHRSAQLLVAPTPLGLRCLQSGLEGVGGGGEVERFGPPGRITEFLPRPGFGREHQLDVSPVDENG